jgi:hypothetical protein
MINLGMNLAIYNPTDEVLWKATYIEEVPT